MKSHRPGVGHSDVVEGVPAPIPRPRRETPESDRGVSLRPAQRPTAEPGLVAVEDLDRMVADLTKVVVRTSSAGSCQENGVFLLGTSDGRWGMVPFTDPGANALVSLLQTLSGFKAELLFEIIGARSDRLVVLWERAEP